MANALERPFNSWDALKLLALGLMFIDHSGMFLYTDKIWIRAIGRAAAPIFMFLAGYASSYRFRKELLALAVVLSLSNLWLTGGELRTQNILFNILICRCIFDWLDRHGKKIDRPYEWVIGAMALTLSIVIVQYGSFGFLFALCGYLQRRRDLYQAPLRRNVMLVSFIFYGVLTVIFGKMPLPDAMLMTAVLTPTYLVLWRFEIRPLREGRYPPALLRLGKFVSYYSGYIYAFHLIALEWISGIPF